MHIGYTVLQTNNGIFLYIRACLAKCDPLLILLSLDQSLFHRQHSSIFFCYPVRKL